MMNYLLPTSIKIDEKEYQIRNKCDYRIVLDVIEVLNDSELNDAEKIQCALFIFYDDLAGCSDTNVAFNELLKIVNNNKEEETPKKTSVREEPKIMDWGHDIQYIIPPINRILGYEVRNPDIYTHWYSFLGAYMEIGECLFSTIINIRKKRMKGKKLDKWEEEFIKENPDMIFFESQIDEDDNEWLFEEDY